MPFRFKCTKVPKCPPKVGLGEFNVPTDQIVSGNCCAYGQSVYTRTVVLTGETKQIAPANGNRKALLIVSGNAGGAIYSQCWFDEFQTFADAATAPLGCFSIKVVISWVGFQIDRKDHGDLAGRSITYRNAAIPSVTIHTYEIF